MMSANDPAGYSGPRRLRRGPYSGESIVWRRRSKLWRIEDFPELLRPKMTVSGAMSISPLSAKHLKFFSLMLVIGIVRRLAGAGRLGKSHDTSYAPCAGR